MHNRKRKEPSDHHFDNNNNNNNNNNTNNTKNNNNNKYSSWDNDVDDGWTTQHAGEIKGWGEENTDDQQIKHHISNDPKQYQKNNTKYIPRQILKPAFNNITTNNKNKHSLPIIDFKDSILSSIFQNQVVIICGATGSGKTTQVPQFILKENNKSACNIICTQPRRLATISVAKRVAEEIGENVGMTVGYQIGMDKCTAGPKTQLLFVTTGVLLQKLVHEKSLRQFTHIILDEVHERDLQTDFVLVIVKQLLVVHPTVRLILMSATINCDLFAGYFPLSRQKTIPDFPSPHTLLVGAHTPQGSRLRPPYSFIQFHVLSVEGQCFPVEVLFIEDIVNILSGRELANPKPDMNECLKAIHDAQAVMDSNKILLSVHVILLLDTISQFDIGPKEENAVLVFLPGLGEIKEMTDTLSQFANHSFWVLPLHSSVTDEEQALIFRKAPAGQRKVILSTNLAESSITVPDVRYVIDFGLVKEIVFDSQTNLESLKLHFASKASVLQRQGRAGRVGPGLMFRMYTSDTWHRLMPDHTTAEMLRCPLESIVLQLKVMDVSITYMLDNALEPPNTENLQRALKNLRDAGGIDDLERITFIGRIYANLPLDIKLSKLLLLGHIFGCTLEALYIAASTSVQSIFVKPYHQPLVGFAEKLKWAQYCESDSITSLYALERFNSIVFRNARDAKAWCKKYYLQYNKILEIEELRRELVSRLEAYNITVSSYKGNPATRDLILKVAIFGAFCPSHYIGKYSELKELRTVDKYSWNQANVNPFRTVVLHGLPYNISDKDIEDLLRPCGKIAKIETLLGKKYVEFERDSPDAVTLALKLGVLKRYVGTRGNRDDRYDNVVPVPIHPFKVTFESMNNMVGIDGQSVNSIFVDHSVELPERANSEALSNVFESHQRFLVAAFASSSSSDGKHLLRETTVLPSIPLIGPILCLLFSPTNKVLLWPNKRHTYYVGVTIDKVQIGFTHVFDSTDLQAVNGIRVLVNNALLPDGITTDYSRELVSSLWGLLYKIRNKINLRSTPNNGDALLMPIVPYPDLHPITQEKDLYDSDADDRDRKTKLVEEIRTRFCNEDEQDKHIACKVCLSPVCYLYALEPAKSQGHFKLTRCYGMALVKGHSVTCKRDHEVGYLDNDELYLFTLPQKSSIDKCRYIEPSSSVVVVIPGEGAPKEWSSTIWKDSFSALGGTKQQSPKPVTKEMLTCQICNYHARDKKQFLHHISLTRDRNIINSFYQTYILEQGHTKKRRNIS